MIKIEYIKTWALSLSFCSLASLLIYFLVPKGSFEKPMRTIIAIFLLSIIISPLYKLKGISFDEIKPYEYNAESEMFSYANEAQNQAELQFKSILKEALTSALNEVYCEIEDLEISTSKNDTGQVFVSEIIIYLNEDNLENEENKEKIIKIIERESGIKPTFKILDK